ncbi:MAG TPA: hypothetical protein VH985_02430, partial [Candidatus Binatia bacterium]
REQKKAVRGIMNKRIQTTLGELIVAVTNEVEESRGRSAATHFIVSRIVNQLLREGKVQLTAARH